MVIFSAYPTAVRRVLQENSGCCLRCVACGISDLGAIGWAKSFLIKKSVKTTVVST